MAKRVSGNAASTLRRPARAELIWEGKYDEAGRRVYRMQASLVGDVLVKYRGDRYRLLRQVELPL